MLKTVEDNRSFVRAMINAVEEYGYDYIYPHEKCVYFIAGRPVCLIGVALVNVGHTEEEMLTNFQCSIGSTTPANQQSAYRMMLHLGYSTYLSNAARNAQYVQDEKGTWGQALWEFKKSLDHYGLLDEYDPEGLLSKALESFDSAEEMHIV